MENGSNTILSDVIKGRCYLKDELLYYNEYDNILPDGYKLNNIIYCEIKNITESSFIRSNKVTIVIEFDLLIIYECRNLQSNTKEYRFYCEGLNRTIDIDKNTYKMLTPELDIETMKCRNIVKDIRYSTDIDINCKKIIIGINASIESVLFKQDVIKLESSLTCVENTDKTNTEIYEFPATPTDINDEDNLSLYIGYLSRLLKKVSEINNVNKKLEKEAAVKDKRISYLEYKNAQLDEKYNKVCSELKEKDALISELKLKLDKSEKKVAILQNTNMIMNQEIKDLSKENNDLKAYIEKEESKKKKQLNYKIKSAISNMKIF